MTRTYRKTGVIQMIVFCKRCDEKFERKSRYTKICDECFKEATQNRKLK